MVLPEPRKPVTIVTGIGTIFGLRGRKGVRVVKAECEERSLGVYWVSSAMRRVGGARGADCPGFPFLGNC